MYDAKHSAAATLVILRLDWPDSVLVRGGAVQ